MMANTRTRTTDSEITIQASYESKTHNYGVETLPKATCSRGDAFVLLTRNLIHEGYVVTSMGYSFGSTYQITIELDDETAKTIRTFTGHKSAMKTLIGAADTIQKYEALEEKTNDASGITITTFNYAEHTGFTSDELPTSTYSISEAVDWLVHFLDAGYEISDATPLSGVAAENGGKARVELTLHTEDKKETRTFTGSQMSMAAMVGTFIGRGVRV